MRSSYIGESDRLASTEGNGPMPKPITVTGGRDSRSEPEGGIKSNS